MGLVTQHSETSPIYKGFVRAQREAYENIRETAALKTMLPWLVHHTEDTEKLMGKDFW
jgi:4,5-dihydroxyphthalate decarboxylase